MSTCHRLALWQLPLCKAASIDLDLDLPPRKISPNSQKRSALGGCLFSPKSRNFVNGLLAVS